MLRFGYQTIIYGHKIPNLERFCELMRRLGFSGVEFFQHPDTLGVKIGPLAELLKDYGLTLLGLSGGSVPDRIAYLDGYTNPYLYLDSFPPLATARKRSPFHPIATPPFTEQEFQKWLDKGHRFGLHPHVGKRIHRASDAEAIFRLDAYASNVRQVQLLLDTAHASITGDNPSSLLKRHWSRIAALHLKDWDTSYGRASHRYAQGFRQIFHGDVQLAQILKDAEQTARHGELWVVVEQDHAELQAEHSIEESARELMRRGWMTPIPAIKLQKDPSILSVDRKFHERELAFRRELDELLDLDGKNVYPPVGRMIRSAVRATAVEIHSYDESAGYKTLISSTKKRDDFPSLYEPALADSLLRQDFIRREEPDGIDVLEFPVFNSFNLNQIRFVVDIHLESQSQTTDHQLHQFIRVLLRATARFLDRHLNEICQRDSARVTLLAAEPHDEQDSSQLDSFAAKLRAYLKKELPCEQCAVYLENQTGAKLLPVGSDDALEWLPDYVPEDRRQYKPGDATTTAEVWQRGIAEWFEAEMEPTGGHSRLRLRLFFERGTKKMVYVLLTPILDARGRCIGVVKCGNRLVKDGKRTTIVNFTSDDLARVDALIQNAVPHIVSLQQELNLQIRHRNVTHELKKPVFVITACLDAVETQFRERIERYGMPPLPYDWLGDAISWCELMQNLVTKPDFLLPSPETPPSLQRVSLLGDIIAPIVRWMGVLVRNRNLPQRRFNPETNRDEYTIDQGDFSGIPYVWVNKNMFQQIFFNLIDNAIKYAVRDKPEAFRIRIAPRLEGRSLAITVEDWGIGLDAVEREAVFREGVRGSSASQSHVTGTGFGLALVRRLVEVHKGTIELTNTRSPTQFTISLPTALQHRDWPRTYSEQTSQD